MIDWIPTPSDCNLRLTRSRTINRNVGVGVRCFSLKSLTSTPHSCLCNAHSFFWSWQGPCILECQIGQTRDLRNTSRFFTEQQSLMHQPSISEYRLNLRLDMLDTRRSTLNPKPWRKTENKCYLAGGTAVKYNLAGRTSLQVTWFSVASITTLTLGARVQNGYICFLLKNLHS